MLKFKKSVRKIKVSKTQSGETLGQLIGVAFGSTDKMVGVTDSQGKFFDMDYLNSNLGAFSGQVLNLISMREVQDENMSFASSLVETYFQA